MIRRKTLGDDHHHTKETAYSYATLLQHHRPDARELPDLLRLAGDANPTPSPP